MMREIMWKLTVSQKARRRNIFLWGLKRVQKYLVAVKSLIPKTLLTVSMHLFVVWGWLQKLNHSHLHLKYKIKRFHRKEKERNVDSLLDAFEKIENEFNSKMSKIRANNHWKSLRFGSLIHEGKTKQKVLSEVLLPQVRVIQCYPNLIEKMCTGPSF